MTPPEAASDLAQARAILLDRDAAPHSSHGTSRSLDAASLRQALVDLHELWLINKCQDIGIGSDSGFALVAVGGLGRREMLPYSDLDLILVHDNISAQKVSAVADQLWYPLWDAHIKLDHSVRTVSQALQVAAKSIPAVLGMLEARHIAGDEELSNLLIGGVRRQWRSEIRWRYEELTSQTFDRWRLSGQIAHRAEPDLKNGRGGLRDVQLLHALGMAQLTDGMPGLREGTPGGGLASAHLRLLDVRTELHRVAGRDRNQLRAQDADDIGIALRLGDRFDLARTLSDCARTVAYSVDVGMRTASNALPRNGFARLRRGPVRRPLAEGVVEHNGEVTLARDANPSKDPGLILRVAAASAVHNFPISAGTLARLADFAPELRQPWPGEALSDLLVLLGSGHKMVPVIESLDRTGLWGRIIPEWGAVRDLPPRDAIHIWTVDRHLVECAAQVSTMTTRVTRPDLLILGALLHDLGKGRGGDHSIVGAELAIHICRRLGLTADDTAFVSDIVRFHLLLPNSATRRDIADPQTIADTVAAVSNDRDLLEVLHALAEADSLATGPGVWGEWKARLINDLVQRCYAVMAGHPLPTPEVVSEQLRELADAGGTIVSISATPNPHTFTVVMAADDSRGLLSKMAGVLAMFGLRSYSATINTVGDRAVNTFTVVPRFGAPPAEEVLRQELINAIAGRTDVLAVLNQRERNAEALGRSPIGTSVGIPSVAQVAAVPAPPKAMWFDGTDEGTAVIELRTGDRPGLLYRVTAELEHAGVDILWARVTTRGASVIDAFSLVIPGDSPQLRSQLTERILAVVPPPEPPPSEDSSHL